jgi:ribose 5-phosphate isomerase B
MHIGIAADHAGFALKQKLLTRLLEEGYDVEDYGPKKYDKHDDYPDLIAPLARDVAGGVLDRGVVICGSGVGACVASNKVRGVRACLIMDPYSARQGVAHGNMNVLCLGGRVVGEELAWELVDIFLSTGFSAGERHCRRLRKVEELERRFGDERES